MLKIGLVEQNDLLREGLTLFLNEEEEFDVIETYKNCDDIISGQQFHEVELLIFDTREDCDFAFIRKYQMTTRSA